MGEAETLRPISEFHKDDRAIVGKIDSVLAGYCAVLPTLVKDAGSVEPIVAVPTEIDRSPHPRHGVPKEIGSAALIDVAV